MRLKVRIETRACELALQKILTSNQSVCEVVFGIRSRGSLHVSKYLITLIEKLEEYLETDGVTTLGST